ncbi:zinc metalloprotease HtpX [bacterium]|nr:zinc metalloprotease HtpX [bacterium]
MANLAFRSLMVLGMLWGMVFAVGVAALYALGLEGPVAVTAGILFALAIGCLQYLISPSIIQWVYKINWMPLDAADPVIATAVRAVCHDRGLREPRFGVIEDGNPNAFTFGHHPNNARVVVTRGLIDLCDSEERKAVVLHEMGHIVHWDFVVMTVAATVPMVLYMIYRFGIASGRGRNRNGGYVALVALMAYVFYLISQYVVLLLSRVREYYADSFSAETSQNPNALASALMKIAYGLARAPKGVSVEGGEKKVTAQALAVSGGLKSMGIFDPGFGASMALAAAGSYSQADHAPDHAGTLRAMRWDVWNPWALVCEISSSHPLPAKRVRALGTLAERMGQVPLYKVPSKAPEGYWDEFLTDLLAQYLPLIGLLTGVAASFGLGIVKGFDTGEGNLLLAPLSAIVAGWALGAFLRVLYKYPTKSFPPRKITDLVGEVKVSQIRSLPSTLEGTVIGRGIPGLYWSEDLVIQDDTGFMVVDYRQPLRIFEFLFGLFRAESFEGQKVTASGWYRRYPRPFLELWQVKLPNGDTHTCHNWALSFYGSLLATLVGLGLLCLGLILQMGA